MPQTLALEITMVQDGVYICERTCSSAPRKSVRTKKKKKRRRLSSWCHIPPEVFPLILVPQTEWMNISLKCGPFWDISFKAPQPHMEVHCLYVCVFAGFVETWNGRGFPQDTPNILRILELPWHLYCTSENDCWMVTAFHCLQWMPTFMPPNNTHPLNKTSSFSFHLKSSHCAYLLQGFFDFWEIYKKALLKLLTLYYC